MPASRHNQKVAVSVVYVAAMFLSIMDSTIVNVALPTIGHRFGVSPDAVDTVAIGYLVSLAIFIPISGWLGDRLGGRRVLLGATLLFTVASACCGLATGLPELVAFRVVQGAGGGIMTPVGMTMLWRVFPPAERVRASSILVIPTALAPAAGPVLGGLLVTDLSWRWVFLVNLPLGLAAIAFGAVALDAHRQDRPDRFDGAGFGLASAGLGALMYGVSEGPLHGWGTPVVAVTLACGVALLVGLVRVELRAPAPVVDLRIFADRLFRSASGVTFLSGIGFLGTLYGLALFYQDGLGLSALGSGLSTFPEAIGVMVGAQLFTRPLYPRLGPRRLMAAGLVATAAGMALLATVGPHTDLWWSRLWVLLMGLGMSAVFIPSQTIAFATIPSEATGRASTLFNAERQLGGAVGVGLLTSVIAAIGPLRPAAGSRGSAGSAAGAGSAGSAAGAGSATAGHAGTAAPGSVHLVAHLAAYHAAFLVAAAASLLAAVAAATVHDRDAAATMVRPPPRTGRRRPDPTAGAGVGPAASPASAP